jgi:hypothetical protein
MRISTRSVSAAAPDATVPSSGSPADSANAKRRRFLLTLGLGGASVAVSATASVSAMVDAAETPPASVDDGRYRETEHVRDYYRTAKV